MWQITIGEGMRAITKFCLLFSAAMLIFLTCKKTPQQNFEQFNEMFFAKYVPEFPDARLMTKKDIPVHAQEFFDEAKGQLQLLSDLNGNDIPEYIICGFSTSMLQRNEKGPYFLTIFEQTGAGIKRLYLQKLLVAPVTLDFSKDPTRKGIIVSFAFYSDYSAEIYFEGNEYHLEKLF